MATPINGLIRWLSPDTRPRYPTRHALDALGIDIQNYTNLPDRTNIMTEAAIKKLTSQLNSLSLRIDSFDRTGNVEDFLEDLARYCSETGRDSDPQKLVTLLNNLTGGG